MVQQAQQYSTNSYMVAPQDHEPPECPPEDMYTLTFIDIKEVSMSKPFKEGDQPKPQFVLNFKIHEPGGEWDGFDLIGWYSPIMHYNPNLPGYSGQRYTEPNLYKLTRALNGGTPVSLPTEAHPVTGAVAYAAYDAAVELMKLSRRQFRAVIGPSQTGWPRLKGDPAPMPQAGARRRGVAAEPQPQASAAAPVDAPDVPDTFARMPGDEDDL